MSQLINLSKKRPLNQKKSVDQTCSNTTSSTVNVIVNSLPVVSLGSNQTICDSDVLTLDAGNPGAIGSPKA